MTQFWILTLASALSKMGNTFLRIAVPIAIFQVTGSASAAIATVALENIPYVVAPALGAIIDRFPRRVVFAISEVSQGVIVAMLPIALFHEEIWLIYVAMLVLGIGSVISNITSEFSLIPSLVDPEKTGSAYARYMLCVDLARFVGPLIGGVIVAFYSVSVALWIDAATFLLTATVVWQLKGEPRAADIPHGIVSSVRSGWSKFRRTPGLTQLTAALCMYNLGVGSIATVMIAIGVSRWGWDAAFTGLVISLGAIVSALGSGLGDRFGTKMSWRGRIVLWMGISALLSFMFLFDNPILAIVAFAGMSFAAGPMNVATMAFRHERIDPAFSGRVNAIIKAFVMGAIPVSAAVLSFTSSSEISFVVFAPVVLGAVLAVLVWIVGTRSRPRQGPFALKADASYLPEGP